MNAKKIISKIALSTLLISSLSLNTTFAEEDDAPPSNFTPNREVVEIDYYEDNDTGAPGFEQVTYNNFKYDLEVLDENNDPIPDAITPIDERTFLFAGFAEELMEMWDDIYCTEQDEIEGCVDFYNGYEEILNTDQVFTDGNLAIFRSFFHNNGEDQYDGSGSTPHPGPANARHTYVGIDLKDSEHPVSFIHSESNRYYPLSGLDINQYTADYNSPINFMIGDYYFNPTINAGYHLTAGSPFLETPAITASDDVTFNYSSELEPVNLNLNALEKLNADLDIGGFVGYNDLFAAVIIEYDYNDNGEIDENETIVEFIAKNVIDDENEPVTIDIPVVNVEKNGLGDNPGTVPLNITFDYNLDQKTAWIEIDSHPSCFRYAGRVYFFALIEREEPEDPPIIEYKACEALTLTKVQAIQDTCDLEPKYTNFEVDVTMNDDSTSGQYVTFMHGPQGDITPKLKIAIPGMMPNEFTTFPKTIKLSNQDTIGGQFYGIGNLTAYFTNADGETINQITLTNGEVINVQVGDTTCIATTDVCDNTCTDICVERPKQIPVGSISEFSAETDSYNGTEWNNEILYETDSTYGEFFDSKQALLDEYPNAYDNPFDQVQCEGMDEIALFIKNIIANLPAKTKSKNQNFLASVLLADIEPIINPNQADFIDTGNLGTPVDTGIGNNFNTLDLGGQEFFFSPDLIPDPPCDEPEPANGIKALQGDTVYFYAKKTGDEKIKVYGECTDEQSCEQTFDIVGSPVCSSVNYSYVNNDEQLSCIKENVPTTIAASNITMSVGGETFTAPQGSVTFDWYSDPTGVGLFSGENPLSTEQTAIQYVSPENTAIYGYLSAFGDTNYVEDQLAVACKFDLQACQPDEELDPDQICELLHYNITSYLQNLPLGDETTVTSLPNNDIYIFESSLEYSVPEEQPNKVDYKTTSQYGVFAVEQDFTIPIVELPVTIPEPVENWSTQKLSIPVTTKVYFYPMQNLTPGTHTNKITIQATSSNPLTEPGCTKYLSIVVPSKNACQNIALHADPSWPPTSTPDSTKFYITGNLGDYDGDFRFNLTAADTAHLSLDNTADENGETTLIVSDSKAFDGVYMFGPTIQTDWIVQVRATDEGDNTSCVSQLTYIPEPDKPDEPDEPDPECKKLTITKPGSSWYLDPEETEEDFEVEVEGTPSNHTWTINWNVPVNPEGIANFNHETSTSYTNILKNPYEGITVFIKVDGTDPGVCEATISPEITEKINPSIKKRVRPGDFGNDPGDSDYAEDWDDLINISAKDKDENGQTILPEDSEYVTYRIDFKPGEGQGVSSALIQETEFKDGVLEGSKGGELVFDGELWIEIYFDNNPEEVYLNDDDDDLEICEYDGNDLENTEICVTNKDLDADDLDDLTAAFEDADEGLVFNNLEDIYKIKIYYEMANETTLDQETCQELDPKTDGCGEQFPNEIAFEAYENNDLEGDEVDSDEDDAMVVAICPFVLTRAGGDVFFSSELTSGIDVAYCSEQKNIQGPSITPVTVEEEEKQEIPKTGPGSSSDQAYLSTPTHDICKYSNVEGASEGVFNNPLKNFSSTICEMKAVVAEEWQQDYIVKQIEKNIGNLARWNETLITNQFPPSTTTNIYSYTDKDITIPGFTISDPAAQTYIVKNGDLNITGDIKYESLNAIGPLDPKNVPSAAFIVIDGNINIAPNVTQLDGVYITIDTDNTDDGQVTSQGFSYTPLTFNGILIGNVADLFSKRRYSGSVSMDQGSVTIKFSQNFLLNTPPGLSDLLDITQLHVAF